MSLFDKFHNAYLEAVYFTETGPDTEYTLEDKLTDLSRTHCYTSCRNFWFAFRDVLPDNLAAQAGHDFWLTRNGHGTGFWDRPELYGEELADQLTRAAKACGEHIVEFIED